jgi:hypothetical protein
MITEEQYKAAATLIGCEPEAIMAVDHVEAPSGGFDPDGKISILFEPHIFYNELRRVGINPVPLIPKYPDLISPVWNPKLYGGHSLQWPKLERAKAIHQDAAERSASYGRYQILGNNCAAAGYPTAHAMIQDYELGEDKMLDSFVKFIKAMGLANALIKKNWAAFAEGYNGAGYKRNGYDVHIANAYNALKKQAA